MSAQLSRGTLRTAGAVRARQNALGGPFVNLNLLLLAGPVAKASHAPPRTGLLNPTNIALGAVTRALSFTAFLASLFGSVLLVTRNVRMGAVGFGTEMSIETSHRDRIGDVKVAGGRNGSGERANGENTGLGQVLPVEENRIDQVVCKKAIGTDLLLVDAEMVGVIGQMLGVIKRVVIDDIMRMGVDFGVVREDVRAVLQEFDGISVIVATKRGFEGHVF